MAHGVTASTYERQLTAWVFLSRALQTNVDQATFRPNKSSRACWESIVDWYDAKTNAQKRTCMRELYNFTIKKGDYPVEKLYAMEDLREKLNSTIHNSKAPGPKVWWYIPTQTGWTSSHGRAYSGYLETNRALVWARLRVILVSAFFGAFRGPGRARVARPDPRHLKTF